MAGFEGGFITFDRFSYTTVGASTNDVEIFGTRFEVTPSNDLDAITSMVSGVLSSVVFVINVDPTGTKSLVIKHNDPNGSAGYRFFVNNGQDLVLRPGQVALAGLSDGVGWFIFDLVDLPPRNFISVHDTTTQNIVTPGTFQAVTFDTNDLLNGWTHTPGSDAMVCPETGLYHTDGFVQMVKTGGPTSLFEFRVTINGTPVGQVSATTLNTNNEVKSLTRTRVVQLTKGDVVRVEWTAGVNSQLIAPSTVGTPLSIAFSLYQIT